MIKLRIYGCTAQFFFYHKMNNIFTSIQIKVCEYEQTEKALSADGKSLFRRVTVVLMQVRSDLYGITILQFFRSTG